MTKDTLFQKGHTSGKFEFNERVAEVFDDMLDRSVPFYGQVIAMIAEIVGRSVNEGDRVYDLGCSTGATLLELVRILGSRKAQFVGVDNSRAMLDKAIRKAEMFGMHKEIQFIEDDITRIELVGAGAVILNYTLQFINPDLRLEFLKKIHAYLREEGVLILSEKIVCQDENLNQGYLESYHQYKKERGYSELEIANKREALENVLIPLTIQKNCNLLQQAGFRTVETFFQWFNFVSILAIK
jgi:tRNA (cmo5U34)-methyltransferase